MIFDVIAFSSLLVAVLLDRIPVLAGFPLLLVVGGLTYVCTRELIGLLFPKRLESMESLATTSAVIIVGFIYFFRRNDSDLILLIITLALMMGSLMLAIALIGCLSERKLQPFLQLVGGVAASGLLAALFAHVLILPTVVPNLGIPAAAVQAASIWWRFAGARGDRDAAASGRRPVIRSRTVVSFVSTFLIGCVGAALAGDPNAKATFLTTGSVGWLTALAGVIGFVVWEAVRPALYRNSPTQPNVIPFVTVYLLDRMVPLMFISTVLVYYFWTPRG